LKTENIYHRAAISHASHAMSTAKEKRRELLVRLEGFHESIENTGQSIESMVPTVLGIFTYRQENETKSV
jgi:hypothetical protein